jgi:hypothetical protein
MPRRKMAAVVGVWRDDDERLMRELVASGDVPALSRLTGNGGFANPRLNYALGQLAFDYIESYDGYIGDTLRVIVSSEHLKRWKAAFLLIFCQCQVVGQFGMTGCQDCLGVNDWPTRRGQQQR